MRNKISPVPSSSVLVLAIFTTTKQSHYISIELAKSENNNKKKEHVEKDAIERERD